MIDGLALGQPTPGSLIMVVAFVGFVGGWTRQVFGPDMLFAGAALAAAVVTWFTFLPSFLFILAGGPLIAGCAGGPRAAPRGLGLMAWQPSAPASSDEAGDNARARTAACRHLHNAAAKESLPQPNVFVYLTHSSRQRQITCAQCRLIRCEWGL